MSDNYLNSIAQRNVKLIIETIYSNEPGANFQKVMIFVPNSEKANMLDPALVLDINESFELTVDDFVSLTKGKLKKYLQEYFLGTQVSTAFVTLWDDGVTFSTALLEEAYTPNVTKAYFKMGISDIQANEDDTNIALTELSVNDDMLTSVWIGISDSTCAIVDDILAITGADAKVVYHYDPDRNGALAQLGRSMFSINNTGFSVGNSLFFVKMDTITPSGSGGVSIDPVLRASLESKNVSFFTFLGDNTSMVVMEGANTLRGENAGANWIRAFIEFVGSIKIAQKITEMNTWRNNPTYQAILNIIAVLLNAFSVLGRFENAKITAPRFSDLPAGTSIIITNGWEATFVDAVTEVTLYGKIYIAR